MTRMDPSQKKPFGFKGWLIAMFLSLLVCGCLFAAFNALIDPFGVFGDKLMNWYAYDMTNNPRVSKIAYLDEHHEHYDSYIIGCSKTSSFSPEKLSAYYDGASFYNMLMYGGDMYDIEKTAEYIIEHYQPKNIIINMGLEEAVSYHVEEDPIKNNLHARVDGSSELKFYLKYLFLHPQYALEKLQAYWNRSYLPADKDVFIPETGVYNKAVRDVEAIGSLNDYLAKYPDFNATYGQNESLPAMEDCLQAVGRIKSLCREKGVTFRLVISPIYHAERDTYEEEDLAEYFRSLAHITDFWDFSGYNSINCDPRYFYDAYHFRNAVGDMALAKMFGDTDLYVPEDFGAYVTEDTVEAQIEKDAAVSPEDFAAEDHSHQIPVLMYHGLGDETDNAGVITPQRFEEQITALKEAGYTALLSQDLIAYVDQGLALPEKSVVITFDDGYQSNLEEAYPTLRRCGMPATIHVIGVSVGKDTYKDTGKAMYPHFTYEEAKEVFDSGWIDFQSHSYDMHQVEALDGPDYRQGVYPKAGESEENYIAAFRDDFLRSKEGLEKNIGVSVHTYAYPYGFNTAFSEALLREMGVRITYTVEPGMNTIVKGLPQSLLCLKRYNVTDKMDGEALLAMLEK